MVPSFLTSALDGDEWSALSSVRFMPGETALVPIGQETGWTSESVGPL
jgi:hypothetical protein